MGGVPSGLSSWATVWQEQVKRQRRFAHRRLGDSLVKEEWQERLTHHRLAVSWRSVRGQFAKEQNKTVGTKWFTPNWKERPVLFFHLHFACALLFFYYLPSSSFSFAFPFTTRDRFRTLFVVIDCSRFPIDTDHVLDHLFLDFRGLGGRRSPFYRSNLCARSFSGFQAQFIPFSRPRSQGYQRYPQKSQYWENPRRP